jgi:hypothetical protein
LSSAAPRSSPSARSSSPGATGAQPDRHHGTELRIAQAAHDQLQVGVDLLRHQHGAVAEGRQLRPGLSQAVGVEAQANGSEVGLVGHVAGLGDHRAAQLSREGHRVSRRTGQALDGPRDVAQRRLAGPLAERLHPTIAR